MASEAQPLLSSHENPMKLAIAIIQSGTNLFTGSREVEDDMASDWPRLVEYLTLEFKTTTPYIEEVLVVDNKFNVSSLIGNKKQGIVQHR